jgi:hypothetical protein
MYKRLSEQLMETVKKWEVKILLESSLQGNRFKSQNGHLLKISIHLELTHRKAVSER